MRRSEERACKGILEGFEASCDWCSKTLQIPYVYASLVCLVLFVFFIQYCGADPDLFARIGAGRLIAVNGQVSVSDPFAFTPKNELWIDHEWLAGVVFYHLSQVGVTEQRGDLALFLFKTLAAFLSILLLIKAQLLYSGKDTASPFWTLWCAVACVYVWSSTVRAQVFTYLFIPIYLLAFVSYQKKHDAKYLLLLPLIMVVWTNCHGGFVVGLGFHFIFVGWCLLRGFRFSYLPLLTFLLSIFATCFTPYGALNYWNYILHATTMERATITEWQALNPFSLQGFFLICMLLCVAIGFWRTPRKRDPFGASLIAVSALYAFWHSRFVAIFTMVLIVYGSGYFHVVRELLRGNLPDRTLKLERVWSLLFIAAVPFLLLRSFYFAVQSPTFALDFSEYPVAALEWLRENEEGGKVLVDFNNGSYAFWRLYPKFLISLDGRYEEVYPEETVRQVSLALDPAGAHHKEALAAVNPDYILLPSVGFSEQHSSNAWGEWSPIYQDEKFSVLSRRSDRNKVIGSAPTHTRYIWDPLF